jgi:hypothetical protein
MIFKPLRSSDPRILASQLARTPESYSLTLVSCLFRQPAGGERLLKAIARAPAASRGSAMNYESCLSAKDDRRWHRSAPSWMCWPTTSIYVLTMPFTSCVSPRPCSRSAQSVPALEGAITITTGWESRGGQFCLTCGALRCPWPRKNEWAKRPVLR